MKIAIFNDFHIGVRNDSLIFAANQEKFCKELFLPTLKERGIGTVLCLGDLFDRRKYINYRTFDLARQYLFDPLKEMGVRLMIPVGNHDTFFRTTNRVNSPRLLLKDYDNVEVFEDATEVVLDGRKILLLPWINEENQEAALDLIRNTDAEVAAGHLELAGFQMYLGSVIPHGMDRKVFDRFKMVMTGHFHHKSDDGKIFYLGAPCEFTWSDYNDPRGFHILDTETLELEYIQNPFRMFRKVFYDDRGLNQLQQQKLLKEFKTTASQYAGVYVRVVVRGKENQVLFEQMLEVLNNVSPCDISITEDVSVTSDIRNIEVDMSEDTLTILRRHVDQMTMKDKDKENLKVFLSSLYQKALESEDA